VPMNEMLTEALRTTKIEELSILDFRSRPKVTAIFLSPAMMIATCRACFCADVLEG
jgi:hypothetical protein